MGAKSITIVRAVKYDLEIGKGAMLYTPSFINISSAIQNIMRKGIHKHTERREIAKSCFIKVD
jgi:hypothetical protein